MFYSIRFVVHYNGVQAKLSTEYKKIRQRYYGNLQIQTQKKNDLC
jgi:hypothetical protein